MENTVEVIEETTSQKPSKVGAIFWGLLVMLIYLVIVSIPQLFIMIPTIIQASAEANGDMNLYQQKYIELLAASADKTTISTVIGTAVAVLVTVLWYYFGVYKKKKVANTVEKVGPKLKSAKSIIFLISVAIAGNAIATFILNIILKTMPTMGNAYVSSMNIIISGVQILGVLLTTILAPIGEEYCLRGLILNRAQKSFGTVGCIIMSGIFFGIYHLNPVQGLYAIPLGMIFAYVVIKYKSVIPGVIIHFINNLISSFTGTIFSNWIIAVIVIIVFSAVAILCAKNLDFFKEEVKESGLE